MVGRIMKIMLSESIKKGERGQAFILVLILLLLGGLMISPLLGFMSTGLIAGQANEERMAEVYAADAGIEDAIWKIMNSQIPAEEDQPYQLTVNNKDVAVTVSSDEDTEITLLINLGVLPDVPASYNKAKPHEEWLVIYAPIESSNPGFYDTYRITGFYSSNQPRDILGTGFWIYGYNEKNGATEVIPWDAALDNNLEIDLDGDGVLGEVDINGVIIDESNVETEPLFDPGYTNYEDDDGDGFSEIVDYLGRAFIWKWTPSSLGPDFNPSHMCRTQRFALNPPLPLIDGRLPPPCGLAGYKTRVYLY